jgi:hypothetical protein
MLAKIIVAHALSRELIAKLLVRHMILLFYLRDVPVDLAVVDFIRVLLAFLFEQLLLDQPLQYGFVGAEVMRIVRGRQRYAVCTAERLDILSGNRFAIDARHHTVGGLSKGPAGKA